MNADPSSPDLYERLGVSAEAGQEEIKSAFKAMRKELHPDSRPESLRGHFDAMMKNVNEAHQTLTDSRARAKYDARRAAGTEYQEHQPDPQPQQQQSQQETYQETPQEEAAHSGDWSDVWNEAWEVFDEATSGHDAQPQHGEPGGVVQGGLVHRLPGPVHRLGIYSLGTWTWFLASVVVWYLPFPGSSILAILGGLAVPLVAAVAWKFTLAHSAIIGTLETLLPGVGRFTAFWYGRRAIESLILAPVVFLVSSLIGFLWVLTFFAAVGYVGAWGFEMIRQKVRG